MFAMMYMRHMIEPKGNLCWVLKKKQVAVRFINVIKDMYIGLASYVGTVVGY